MIWATCIEDSSTISTYLLKQEKCHIAGTYHKLLKKAQTGFVVLKHLGVLAIIVFKINQINKSHIESVAISQNE